MNSIKATWTNGQIVPAEPVDWPEGSQLVVAPVAPNGANIGISEDQWRDDPEAVAAWVAAVEQIEPLIWKKGEREEYERYRAEHRQANIQAVWTQMQQTSRGDDAE
ncbi:MAG TPA: hypothetical protein VFI31_06495 [Pirellulales bacterium]|nr:hypothetical protein [Pirellulales bacterium]